MLTYGLHSTSDDRPDWLIDSNPICHPSPAKRMKCSFLDYVRLLMIAWAGQWTLICPPPLSCQKNKMLIFGLCSTSDDWPGWLMDWNPSVTPLQSKKLNAHFRITFNFWWSAGQVKGLKPRPPALSSQKKKLNACFWNMFNFWWLAGLVDRFKTHLLPISSQKIKCSFLDYIQLLMIGRASCWTQTPSATPLQSKK